MNKVIDGYAYDTDLATKLAHYEEQPTLKRYFCETLYKTSRGRLFLHCCGNGHSKYGRLIYGKRASCELLKAVNRAEAFRWASERLEGEAVKALFPDLVREA
jgi:hypothetical protein